MRHAVEYALYRLAEGLLRHLPWTTAQAMGEVAGAIAFWADRRHRRTVLNNLRLSDLDLSDRETVNTAKACFRHFGALAFTLPQLLFMGRGELSHRVRFEGLEHWDAAAKGGRGFIGLTGHYGNWEAMALVLSATGRPLAVIGRRLENPLLDNRLRELRTRFGNQVINKSGAMKATIRALREGMAVGFLLDQDARSQGVFTEFLGRQASTHTAAAALALRFCLPVIPIFSHPLPDGTLLVRAEPPLELPAPDGKETDIQAATQTMNRALERQIRHTPHAWFWMHRRFKTQPQAAGQDLHGPNAHSALTDRAAHSDQTRQIIQPEQAISTNDGPKTRQP